jgi:peptidyl-prolyl cis-trans isomerase C
MVHMMKFSMRQLSVLCATFVLIGSAAHAQPMQPKAGAAVSPTTNAPLATVNGIMIPESLLEQNVRANVAQGQRDTPELRQLLKDELINREILAQEAAKLGLDKTAEARTQLAQLRQTLMVELLLTDMMKKNPITDVKIVAEYDRMILALKNEQQYRIGLIVTSTEDEAKAILARLNKGESFKKIAEQSSIDPSKEKGGDVGWVLPAQILPAISNVMVNLKKGSVAVAPIRTQSGWNIIKLEDQRSYQPPSLNEAKNDLRQALLQQQRVDFVKRLREGAKIQ